MTTPIKVENSNQFITSGGSAVISNKHRQDSLDLQVNTKYCPEQAFDQEQIKHEIEKGVKSSVKDLQKIAEERQKENFMYLYDSPKFLSQFEELKNMNDSRNLQID